MRPPVFPGTLENVDLNALNFRVPLSSLKKGRGPNQLNQLIHWTKASLNYHEGR
jgi:hypothetical protein